MTIKIEFPAGDALAAQALGRALLEYSGENTHELQVQYGCVKSSPDNDQDAANDTPPDVAEFTAEGEGDTSYPDITISGDNDSVPVDHNGVAFNPEYCGESKEPFYASGQRSGQWKKKRGVDQDDYDKWYAGELAALQSTDEAPAPDVDTATAFGGNDAPAPTQSVPRTAGEYVAWASEQQAAGNITSDDINAAFSAENLGMTDLFAPNPEDVVAERIGRLYARLTGNA